MSKPQSKANALYTKATAQLRADHREEFEKILEQCYRDEGLVYKKRLTPEEREAKENLEKRQKAMAELEKIYGEHPELRPVVVVGEGMKANKQAVDERQHPYGGAHPISPEDAAKVPPRP
jgi:hypothetical protein